MRERYGEDIARTDDPTRLEEGPVLAEHREPTAWLLFSRLAAREFWLAKDEPTAERLATEHPGVPVLTLAEVPYLEGKPPELLRAILDTKAVFPDARVRE